MKKWSIVVCCFGLLLMAACGGTEGGSSSPAAGSASSPDGAAEESVSPSPEAAIAEGELVVTGTELALTVPTSDVAAGSLEITLNNEGTIAHEMLLLELPQSPPIHELAKESKKAVMKAGTEVGGIQNVAGGESGTTNVDLEPGAYGMFCLIGFPDGKTHASFGMWRQINVV